jgi:glycosyltransferase involved in cell wall biosynthesis
VTKIAIVVPCYNEEEVLSETASRLLDLLKELIRAGKISDSSFICFVDDGSADRTWSQIQDLSKATQHIKGIKLSNNCGHQNALLAGLFSVDADAVISIDADLQDDINVIREMLDNYLQGDQIVYAVRKQRDSDSFFKRTTAQLFYGLMNFLGTKTIYNHADYRLMSRRAIQALKEFREINMFLRGVIPLIGFKHSIVYYDRSKRFAGESKYPLNKMLSFAWNGVTSFSVMPLRLISGLGFLSILASVGIGLWALYSKLFGEVVPGWASIIISIYFIGGVQLLCFGILGEYIGKLYQEVKDRPRYFIELEV